LKVAVTLNGVVGGLFKKNYEDTGESDLKTIVEYVYKSLDKCLLQNNDIDIFIFSWHPNEGDYLDSIYKPKKSKHINQIVWENLPVWLQDHPPRVQAHISRWYGFKEVMKLRQEYEMENNIKYDLVLNGRFDHFWEKNILFSELDVEKIHTSTPTCVDWGWPHSRAGIELRGDLFVMKPEYIDKLALMYDNIYEYTSPGQCPQWKTISHHFLTVWHFRKMGWLTKEMIEFSFPSCIVEMSTCKNKVHQNKNASPVFWILRLKTQFENLTIDDLKNKI